jgi:hypothetical protein
VLGEASPAALFTAAAAITVPDFVPGVVDDLLFSRIHIRISFPKSSMGFKSVSANGAPKETITYSTKRKKYKEKTSVKFLSMVRLLCVATYVDAS